MVAPNAGPMTFKGTNTYVVGHGAVAIIDPGPDDARACRGADSPRSQGETRGQRSSITHTHRDHSPAARPLKAATGAPIVGCAPHRGFSRRRIPRRKPRCAAGANDFELRAGQGMLADGDTVGGRRVFTLEAVATPGHTMNHLAFALREERALFSGDHVMAWSTTIDRSAERLHGGLHGVAGAS